MKHLPPDQFEKAYVKRILGLIILFIVFAIASVILSIPELEMIWIFPAGFALLSVTSLGLAWLIILKYRHRMKHLYQEILELDFKRFTDGQTPYLMNWMIVDDEVEIASGHEITFTDEGITCDHNHHLLWKDCLSFETTHDSHGWKSSLYYRIDEHHYQLTCAMDQLTIKIIEHYTKLTLNQEKLQKAQEETYQIFQSEIVWGTNVMLWVQRIGFIAMVSITGIGGGILLGLYVIPMEFAVLLANLFIIPIVLIVYPKRYSHYPSYRYWMNKFIIGYARGKHIMVVPFEKIESMSFDEKKLYINLKEQDEDGDPIMLYIPRDRYLIDRLTEHLAHYSIPIQIIKL